MSREYKRGQRAFGEQPGRRGNDRWDKNIVKLDKPPMRKPVLVRPVGGILTVGVHYLKFRSPRDGQFTGFMTLCPNWNIAEGEDQDIGCPICRHFHYGLKIEDKKFDYLRMPQKYRYLFHAFHVTNIQKGHEQTFGVIETHALGIEQIEEAMLVKGQKPDDPQHGFCLNWLRKEAKMKEFSEEITFSAGEDMPVRELKEGVWGIVVGSKKIKGVEQDLLAVIAKPPTVQDLDKKLAELGLYATLDKVVGGSRSSATRTNVDDVGDGNTEWDENENASDDAGTAWDNDETEEVADPDADEWDNDEEGTSEDSSDDAAAGDGDGEDEAWEVESPAEEEEADADADEWEDESEPEPEPKKKPARKKPAAKKPAAKKPAKKATKKAAKKSEPEPEEADANEWSEDDDPWD